MTRSLLKKFNLIILLFSIVQISVGQDNPFYYYQGNKIFLSVNTEKVLIRFSKNFTKDKIKEVVDKFEGLEMDFSIDEVGEYTLMKFRQKERENKDVLIAALKSRDEILSINYLFEYTEGKPQAITDEFIVKLKPETQLTDFISLIKKEKCEVVKENQFVKNQFSIVVRKHDNVLDKARIFYESGLFEFAEPNFLFFDIFSSNDPLYDNQWSLKNNGQSGGLIGADIKIEEAWTITEGSPDIRIAIIDGGVDMNHPDLAANIVGGFDASGEGAGGNVSATDNSHGTACAGIVAAIKDNGLGIAGIAPKCKLLSGRVNFSLPGTTSSQNLADAINWANWQANSDVISCSWKIESPVTAIEQAISSATTYGRAGLGSIVISGTGNQYQSTVKFPASLPNVIAVGATSKSDYKEDYSNYGGALDISAPGGFDNIYTTDIAGALGYSNDDYTSTFSGTSAATPHISGVAALILSVNRCLSWSEVKRILELSADKVGGYCYNTNAAHPNGTWSNLTGHGRVNAFKAVQYAHSQVINTYSNISGNDQGPVGFYQWALNTGGCSGLAAANYIVKRHEVNTTVSYPYTQAPYIMVNSNGFSPYSPNDGNFWALAANTNETSATLKTYVYEITNILGQSLGWVPRSPANIRFDFTVLSALQTNFYLQNSSITAGMSPNYTATHAIEAGNNVTSSLPPGDYVLEPGSAVTLTAGNTVVLKPGFHVKNGALFTARANKFFVCTAYPNGRTNNDLTPKESQSLNFETHFEPMSGEMKKEENPLNVYPNPFSSKFTISYLLQKSSDVTVTVIDVKGREVLKLEGIIQHEAGSYKIDVEGEGFDPGIYIVTVKSNEIVLSTQIVKQ
jgi:subtilisin family serine protease